MAMEALRIAAKESKFMKFILGGFIFLAVGGLVFTDVGGYFTGSAGGTTVARVGDTKVDIRQFDSELRGFLRQTGMTTEEAYNSGLIDVFLQGKIGSILRLKSADDLDIVLNNETIAKQIQKTFQGATKDQIQATLRAQGLSEQQLAESIQLQTINRYVSAMPLAVANYVPSFTQSANKKIQAEQRSGKLYTISLDALADKITVNDDEIMNYYQSNQSRFTVPEERVFTIGKMTLDMAKKGLPSISDEDIRAEYDSRPSDFIVPEKRAIEQAVTKNADDAQDIYEAVLKGAELKNALRDVTGDDSGYRAETNYEENGLPAELSDAAFAPSVNAGDVTPPVKTLLGYTIMVVKGITAETVKLFDNVKKDLKKEMEQTAIYDSLYNKMVDTEDMIDSGSPFSEIAEKTNLKTLNTKSFSLNTLAEAKGDLKAIIDAAPSVVDELFTLPEGGASYPLEIDDTSYAVIGIKNIEETAILPLEDVRKDIEKTIRANKKSNEAEIALSKIVNDLNSETTTLKDVQSKYRAKIKPFTNLKRDTKSENKELIFSIEKGGYDYRTTEKEAILVTITDVNFNNKNAEIAIETITSAQRNVIDSLLMQHLRDNTKISINENLLERTYSTETY